MASEKARLAKDKGNAAFKSGDYPTAVGHYTDAILADGRDHTFFLNRAAAYLKLGKAEDAERDCTAVLALSHDNVKALFRRAQARRIRGHLDDARADLDKALVLEPANESIRNEMQLSSPQKLRQRSKAVAATPRRRRVPLAIVDADTAPADLLQPVSSRPLKSESKPSTPPSKPQTFADAKQAREESKPVRVSGGIFRHTGNHTLVTRTWDETASSPRPRSTPSTTNTPPTTLFQFTKSWGSLQSDADKWHLLRTIPPSAIPALFQVSLEPELLRSVLHTFQATLEQDPTPSTRDVVRDYLLAFTKVQRFGTVMLFMEREEKRLLDLLHEKVDS